MYIGTHFVVGSRRHRYRSHLQSINIGADSGEQFHPVRFHLILVSVWKVCARYFSGDFATPKMTRNYRTPT